MYTHTQSQCEDTMGEECLVKMQAEIGLIHPQARDYKDVWLPPEAKKNEMDSTQREHCLLINWLGTLTPRDPVNTIAY